ncbi:GntR family transcriptional regulator [Leucobacter luti]|nr:GntR family transcriptional regulator [Leucobacter luti]
MHQFRADPASADPPYQQLRASVRAGIRAGALVPGERLPTVRALAAATGLAGNTIASAYRALEEDGLVEGRGRAGTFVTIHAGGDGPARAAAREFAERMISLGVALPDAVSLVRDVFEARAGGTSTDAPILTEPASD